MPIPLLAIFAAGIAGQRFLDNRGRQNQAEAFSQGLQSFIRQPGAPEIATGFPGLTPEVGATIQRAADANPAAGRELLKFHLNIAEGATAEQRAADDARIKREQHDIRKDELARGIEQFRIANDPDLIAERSQALKGFSNVFDPMTGVMRFVPDVGTEQFDLRVEKALSLAEAQDKFNALKLSVAQFGVARKPSDLAFTDQQSLQAQFVLSVKKAEALGALDQGALDFTSLLTGEQLDPLDFFFGSDAASLNRLQTTNLMFASKMKRESENIRLLRPGMVPSQVLRFDRIQDETQQINRMVNETIQRLQAQAAATGATADVRNQPGVAGRGDTGDIPSRAFRSPLDDIRTTGIMLGGQLDVISSAVFGFFARSLAGGKAK